MRENLLKIFGKTFKFFEKKSYGPPPFERPVGGVLGEFLATEHSISPTQAFRFYEQCQAVATVIDIIAETAADAPIVLTINNVPVKTHPLLSLLQSPHPDFTGRLFMNVLMTHYLITGECFVFAGGNIRQPPRLLAPISPSNVNVEPNYEGFSSCYQVSGLMYPGAYKREKRKNLIDFYLNNMMQLKHIRNFSVKENSQLRGQSKLSAVAMDVRQNLEGGRHNLRTLIKGGRLSLVFNIKDDMSYEQFRNAKNTIVDDFSGPEGNSIGVVNADQIAVQELGKTNQDMDFATLQSMTEKAVAKRYNVPMPLISDKSATFNNLTTAYESLYDNAVVPIANQILDGLSNLLFPRFKLDSNITKLSINEAKITALASRAALVAQTKRNSYTYTDNEIRSGFGLEAIDNGNSIYRPSTWVSDEIEEY